VLPNGNRPRVARHEEPHIALLGVIAGSSTGTNYSEVVLVITAVAIDRHPPRRLRGTWSCFELLDPASTARGLVTGTVDGVTPLGTARDGLRPPEATADNATSRSSLWSGTSRIQIETHHRMGR